MSLLIAAASQPASTPVAVDQWIKGHVERVGTVANPQLNLVSENDRRYELVGELTIELAGLESAKLELLCSREHEGSLLPRLRVINYRILDIGGGEKPEIGVVKVSGEQVSISDSGRDLKLVDTQLARNLRRHVGQKVWVVGKVSTSGLFKAWRVGFLTEPKLPAAALSSAATSLPTSMPTPSQPVSQ